MTKKHYQTLGVSESATPEEIKNAYRQKAKELHPDKNPGDPHAEEMFKELARAYEVLSDPDRREKYDQTGSDAQNNEQEQVMALIASLTQQFLSVPSDEKTENLAEFIRDHIRNGVDEAENMVKVAKRAIEKATNAANRTKKTSEGTNIILMVLEDNISKAETAIKHHEESKKLLKKALEEMEGYSYLVDQKPPRSQMTTSDAMDELFRTTGFHFRTRNS